jgi:hypothetical protein
MRRGAGPAPTRTALMATARIERDNMVGQGSWKSTGSKENAVEKCRKTSGNRLKNWSVSYTTSCFSPNFTMAGALVAHMLRGVAGGAVRGARRVRHLSTSSSSVAEMTEKLKACSTQVSAWSEFVQPIELSCSERQVHTAIDRQCHIPTHACDPVGPCACDAFCTRNARQ